MAVDVTTFNKLSVADTCAVWNVLSSSSFYRAALVDGCVFCITEYTNYECLYKPRKTLDAEHMALMSRLRDEQSKGRFAVHSIELEGLLDVEVLERRRNLGKGELTAIAFAKAANQSFLSEDDAAGKLASEVLGAINSQTTSQLFGWLFFIGRLFDHECELIISEQEKMGRMLRKRMQRSYEEAMYRRLVAQSASPGN